MQPGELVVGLFLLQSGFACEIAKRLEAGNARRLD
jgi:hypothetical protein